ncbi:DEAD/DEAH box helicase [Chloroflexota bacterium]
MERALDPELIGIALGSHENLPTPEEVSRLLAEAELAILLRKPEISEEIEAIGWYLHAVASSKYALQAYGVDRQRKAFQVSAHIFDLLLQMPLNDLTDRLNYCFACQIAYLRSELNPNSIAIYKREFAEKLGDLDLLNNHQEVALSCSVGFLGLDVNYVYRITNNLRNQTSRLVSEWEVEDIFSTPFGAAAGVAVATRDLTTFLLYGDNSVLERARVTLQRAVVAEPSLEDHVSRWVAAHLLNLSSELENSSVWTVLPPDVPNGVRRAFGMGQPKILTLWPPQLDILRMAENDTATIFSPDVKRSFLSTPTSGGKTLIAQLMVASYLATGDASVCYVAPTRSLCNEVRNSLASRLRYIGTEVVGGLPEGDWLDEQLSVAARVEVMTPERLSYLIRSDSKKVLERFGMFIFDEVHSVGEKGRGWTLEEDLSYLHYATQGKHHRIVLMSAAVGNRVHILKWMSNEDDYKDVAFLHSDWRGPRRLHAICSTKPNWLQPQEEVSRSARFPKRIRYPLHSTLHVRISHTGKMHSLQTTEPVGSLIRKYKPDNTYENKDNESTPFYKMLVPIIQHLSVSGPVLIIESTRRDTVLMAKAIAESQETSDQQQNLPLVDLIEARLGDLHPLTEVIKKGVAYHHGSLPSEIREAIEEAVTQGHLKFLVATTTMTEGVNLPVRSVVVARQGSWGPEGYNEYITGSKLINAIGRAGRATKETEGVVVLARQAQVQESDFDRLNPTDSDIEINSMLSTEEALNALAEFEILQRSAEDAILESSSPQIDQFLSFIWFIAAQLEALGKAVSTDELKEVLGKTLAWVQLDSDNQNRWLATAGLAISVYGQTEPSSRKRWATVGTSLSSAKQIEIMAEELATTILSIDVPSDPLEVVILIMADGRLQRMLEFSEAPKTKIYTQRSGHRQQIEIQVNEVLRRWIEGTELLTLSETYLVDVANIEFRFEQLADFINDYFETFLPWIFGVTIEWTNNLLKERGVEKELPGNVSALIRWGVSNSHAVNLMVGGIRSRRLATKIIQIWETEKRDDDIRTWIRSMNISQWRDVFEASITELRNLLEFSKDQVKGVAVDLIASETARIDVESNIDNLSESSAKLALVDESALSPIGIWVGDQLVGQVYSKDQVDIQSILDSGLILSIKFSASSRSGLLELQLVDPDTQLEF